MLHRIALAALVALALSLGGCKDYKDTPVTNAVEGSRFIKVSEAHLISTGEPSVTLAGSTTTYLLVRLEFNNDTASDIAPAIEQIIYVSPDGTRLHGNDAGSTVFIGVSNYKGIVKKGEKHEYTVGFRLNTPTQGGYIYYDPSS